MNLFHIILCLSFIYSSYGRICGSHFRKLFHIPLLPRIDPNSISEETNYDPDERMDFLISLRSIFPELILTQPQTRRRALSHNDEYYPPFSSVSNRLFADRPDAPSFDSYHPLSNRGAIPPIDLFHRLSFRRPERQFYPSKPVAFRPGLSAIDSYRRVAPRHDNALTDIPKRRTAFVDKPKVPINSNNPSKHPNWKLVNDEKCGSNSENRIVGGMDASLGQYPWIARIGYRGEEDYNNITYRCGGTLISKTHVVTAAHCAINLPESFQVARVRLGEYDTSKTKDCIGDLCAAPHRDFDIAYVVVHKYYGEPKNANDIALIKMNDTVQFTEWITPICLPYGSLLKKNLTGQTVDIAGWGYYDVTIPQGAVILQTVKLPVLPIGTCSKKFRRYSISETKQICVGGIVGKDSCNGDSGGPLMKVDVEGNGGPKFYLFGVVSYGATYCGLTTNPAIYTNVMSYMKWILDNMTL